MLDYYQWHYIQCLLYTSLYQSLFKLIKNMLDTDYLIVFNKMPMLQSNMIRVASQNKRLRSFVGSSQIFDKLQQHIHTVIRHSQKLNQLSVKVQLLNEEAAAQKQIFNQLINQSSDFINKQLSQIQVLKLKDKFLFSQLTQIQQKYKISTKREVNALKTKMQEHVKEKTKEYFQYINQLDQKYLNQAKQVFVANASTSICNFYSSYQQECREGTGHLYNLIDFQNHKRNSLKIMQLFQLSQYQKIGFQIKNLTKVNCDKMNDQLNDIDITFRQIQSQLQWFKSKQRKKKTTSQNTEVSSVDLNSHALLDQSQMAIHDTERLSIALSRICDRLFFERAISRQNNTNSSQMQIEEKTFLQMQWQRCSGVGQKIGKVKNQIENYRKIIKKI